MNDETESRRIFRQPLNYENGVLLPLIRDIAYWRVADIKSYESGIQTLMILLPSDLRVNVFDFWNHGSTHEDLTKDGKKDFDDLFIHILKLLEDNNICFPKISYDIGHD